jgi:hypothetical protein
VPKIVNKMLTIRVNEEALLDSLGGRRNMENKEFNEKLVASIPEILKPYKEAKEWWDDEEPGTTIVVEDYLMPLIYKAIERKDKALLSKFAIWLEDMVSLKDGVVDSTIYVGVFEKAFFEGKIDDLKPYFLKETNKMYESISFPKR